MKSQVVDTVSNELLNMQDFRGKRKASVWGFPSHSTSEYLRLMYADFATNSFLPIFLIFLASHTSSGSPINFS